MNMPKPIENFDAVEKATFEKTFALAAEKLEECCKQSGIGEFVKTSVSAIWYRDGSYDRVFYDPDCFPRQNICPMLEVYHEGNEEGHTYGLNTEEDVSEYIKER
jgi:hypothetical protein|tara:strand:+ start:356 stop:667 length:312 start_codon:yes stop_codon:yes gene_type:complete